MEVSPHCNCGLPVQLSGVGEAMRLPLLLSAFMLAVCQLVSHLLKPELKAGHEAHSHGRNLVT